MQLRKTVKRFHDAQMFLESEKCVTISPVPFVLAHLQKTLQDASTPSTPIPAVTKSKTGPELFDDMFESLQVADSAVAEVIDELFRYLAIPKLPATPLHEQEP
eukprot:scaffold549_cov174-Ochromonas_danica.AAC.2